MYLFCQLIDFTCNFKGQSPDKISKMLWLKKTLEASDSSFGIRTVQQEPLYLPIMKSRNESLEYRTYSEAAYALVTGFLALCFLANFMFLKYLGSRPLFPTRSLGLGFLVGLRWFLRLWLWAVWFLDLAILRLPEINAQLQVNKHDFSMGMVVIDWLHSFHPINISVGLKEISSHKAKASVSTITLSAARASFQL